MSRLDIARKVIDNLHPGFAQFGNVWPPLPQMLMVPFTWNSYLWHSGIAGSLMSMPLFILGGFYIYKTAKLLTNSIIGSFLGLSIYSLNINMLFLQTTAMSEPLFMFLLAATIYYFVKWVHTRQDFDLIPAAIAVSAMTYTRYEGLSILSASIPMVILLAYIFKRSIAKTEGLTILYTSLAITGFMAWTIYLWAIFGDPFYWLHIYATPSTVTSTSKQVVHVYSQHKPIIDAVLEYFTSFAWTIGLIPTLFGFLGLIVMFIKSIRTRTLYFIPLLMPLAIYLFLVLSLRTETPIVQPALNIQDILSPTTSSQTGFNIRYGILLLPWVAIMSSYIFSLRFKVISILIFLLFLVQLFNYPNPRYTSIYNISYNPNYTKAYPLLINWFKSHYTGGEIMISAKSHENEMFLMGFDYKTYIQEGAGKYWKESIDNPSRYAQYVVIDAGHPDDSLAPYFLNNSHRMGILERDYNLAFNDDKENVKIYKKKVSPYFKIN
jgi:hypothetical protein